MAVTDRTGLIGALASSRFDVVLGTAEADWVDFKGEAYHLDRSDQVLELLKDVTALANSGGGLLVLGYRTEKQELSLRDVATKVRMIPRSRIKIQQYLDLIEQGTYPPIRNVTVHWWPEDGDSSIFVFDIPPTPPVLWPTLVKNVPLDEQRRALLIGLFERSGEATTRFTAEEIHRWIQTGRRVEQAGQAGMASQEAVESVAATERLDRLQADVKAAGLDGQPRYYLQSWPDTRSRVQRLREPDSRGLPWLLGHPQSLRDNGFGIRFYDRPRPLSGGGIWFRSSYYSMSLQNNGLLTWIAPVTSDWLAWGDERRKRNSINPLTLVESTLEFLRLFVLHVIPQCNPRPETWSVSGGMEELSRGAPPPSLAAGRLGSIWHEDEWHETNSDNFEVGPYTFRDEQPGRVAFTLLREIYAEWGLPETAVPYAKDEQVSEDAIANVGR